MSSSAATLPEVEATPATRELVRALSLRDAIALVLTVIGTGVFLKAAPMAQLVGSPSKVLLVWVAAGLLSLAGALTYAELGAMIPEAGGDYVFLREAYGGLPAFLFGWTNLAVIATGGIAAVATILASFLSAFLPLDAVWATRDFHLLGQVVHWRLGIQQLVAVAVIILFSAINARGVAAGARVQWIATLAKLGGIAIIVLGAFLLSHTGTWQHLRAPVMPGVVGGGVSAFGAAMLAALWAYQGWANVAMVGGEIEKPERNIPRALIYGMGIVIGVYLVTNLAYFYALPFNEVLTSNSTAYRDALPVAAKAAQSFFGYGAKLVSIAFIIAVIGTLNGIILMNARVPYAMARDGLFFRKLGDLSPATNVPVTAIWVQAIWASVLALSGTFDQITTSVIFALWLFFGLVASSLFVLRRKLPAAPRRYRTPGYPVVPILFVLVAVWLVVNSLKAYPVESGAGLFLIALGLPFFFFFRRTGWLTRARMKERPGS
ncbi:MAG: basic amino acid/polyamine antiporter, family [Gemmatimonadaceae bacterium]|nr:basic amino acid/polyamine antiporter, family [Gemmatimonadaceae bacterium]